MKRNPLDTLPDNIHGALRLFAKQVIYLTRVLEATERLIALHDEQPSMLTEDDWKAARKAVANARKVLDT